MQGPSLCPIHSSKTFLVVVVSINQAEGQKSVTQNWNTGFYVGFMLVLTSASLHELLGYYSKKSVSKQIINVKRPDGLNGIFDQTTLN